MQMTHLPPDAGDLTVGDLFRDRPCSDRDTRLSSLNEERLREIVVHRSIGGFSPSEQALAWLVKAFEYVHWLAHQPRERLIGYAVRMTLRGDLATLKPLQDATHLEYVDLENIRALDPQELRFLPPSVKSVTISCWPALTNDALRHVPRQVTHLTLSFVPVTSLAHLPKWVVGLHLACVPVTEVAGLPNDLECLWVTSCNKLESIELKPNHPPLILFVAWWCPELHTIRTGVAKLPDCYELLKLPKLRICDADPHILARNGMPHGIPLRAYQVDRLPLPAEKA